MINPMEEETTVEAPVEGAEAPAGEAVAEGATEAAEEKEEEAA